MASECDKAVAVNAIRGAESALHSAHAHLLNAKAMLEANGWAVDATAAETAITNARRKLAYLHEDVYVEAQRVQEAEPRTGVVEPMSGGGSKGGNPL